MINHIIMSFLEIFSDYHKIKIYLTDKKISKIVCYIVMSLRLKNVGCHLSKAYYRQQSAQLYKELKKFKTFKWILECEASFIKLKEILTS